MRATLVLLLLGCEGATLSGTADGSAAPPTGDAAGGIPDAAIPAVDASVDAPPPVTAPAPLVDGAGFYPRAIRTRAGTILASVVTPLPSGHLGGTILESTDDGVTFVRKGAIDDPVAQSGLCCATLYELPHDLGGLSAGSLIWAASIGGDTPSAPMSIRAWASRDGGATWTALATIATGAVPRSRGGLWEPEFSQLDDGSLVCHFSDETDSAHSQKLVARRSTDGVSWNLARDTVALAAFAARPGMANVRRLPDGSFAMSYEVCGTDACAAHFRKSADGWDWGNVNDAGLRPATIDGRHFRHAPTLVWADSPGRGRFYLIGQMAYESDGSVSAANGRIILANTEGGFQNWFEVPAPVPVPSAYDNFCPNYSSTLLPLDGNAFVLEIASQYDGNNCRPYFARTPLGGTGDASGVTSGGLYRLRAVMSGLCLDVSGGSTQAGANIQQWTCNNLAPQNWTLEAAGGAFTLRSQQSGMCLAAAGDTAGANVAQQPCDGSATQSWSIRNVGLGYYELSRGGNCLDVAGGSTMAGGNVQQWTCNQLSPQIWHLETR